MDMIWKSITLSAIYGMGCILTFLCYAIICIILIGIGEYIFDRVKGALIRWLTKD